jgi:two-component sensor histidine kinase
LTAADSRGLGWLKAVHPDERMAALALLREGLGKGPRQADYRIRHKAGNEYRWFQTRVGRSRDAATGGFEWLGVSMEIDDPQAVRDEHSFLQSELQHRIRNTLGVMRSITRRTAETSETVEDFAMHLEGRLDALARAQAALSPTGQAPDRRGLAGLGVLETPESHPLPVLVLFNPS